MLDRIVSYRECLEEPERWAVATIISVAGSSPSPAGTSMAVSADLEIIGSLSGGCVESVTASMAQQAIADGHVLREKFGPDGGVLGEVSLTCGGEIEVLIQPLSTVRNLAELRNLAMSDPRKPAVLVREVPGVGEIREHRAAAARLILSGVHDFSVHLAGLALQCGWQVDLVDLRPAFGTAQRVPAGVELSVGDPASEVTRLLSQQRSAFTAVCVMTHHPDLDVPVLSAALEAGVQVQLIGAMGSRTAQARRDAQLRARGYDDAQRARVRSPLGLDLGACTAAESAVSMFAQLVLEKNLQRTGGLRPSTADAQAAGPRGSAPLLADQPGPINSARPRLQSLVHPLRSPTTVPNTTTASSTTAVSC